MRWMLELTVAMMVVIPSAAWAVDATPVTCGSNYFDVDFNDAAQVEDDDCGSYSGCNNPIGGNTPDRVLSFSLGVDAWVEVTADWGREDPNFYVVEGPVCGGTTLSCGSGFGSYALLTGYFEADSTMPYGISFDSPGGGMLTGPAGDQHLNVDILCCPDDDGDGTYDMTNCSYGPVALGDCDDTDPNNNPSNTEICDGQDNDCDGLIDEGFAACAELICDDSTLPVVAATATIPSSTWAMSIQTWSPTTVTTAATTRTLPNKTSTETAWAMPATPVPAKTTAWMPTQMAMRMPATTAPPTQTPPRPMAMAMAWAIYATTVR